jgi:membrane dipeptidase
MIRTAPTATTSRCWRSLVERSLCHAEKLNRAAAASEGKLRVIRTPAELDALLAERARGATSIGAMLSIEGLQNLEASSRTSTGSTPQASA